MDICFRRKVIIPVWIYTCCPCCHLHFLSQAYTEHLFKSPPSPLMGVWRVFPSPNSLLSKGKQSPHSLIPQSLCLSLVFFLVLKLHLSVFLSGRPFVSVSFKKEKREKFAPIPDLSAQSKDFRNSSQDPVSLLKALKVLVIKGHLTICILLFHFPAHCGAK